MRSGRHSAVVLEQKSIAEGIFDMWIKTPVAPEALPGQFINIYSADAGRMLPRPISICEADSAEGRLRVVYRVAGKGTEEFSHLSAGDSVDIMGPLGNGFPDVSIALIWLHQLTSSFITGRMWNIFTPYPFSQNSS